jgi:hypothetical protein
MKTIKSATAAVWRLRARHNRALIEHMQNPSTRNNLQRLADEYDALAHRADEAQAEAAVRAARQ